MPGSARTLLTAAFLALITGLAAPPAEAGVLDAERFSVVVPVEVNLVGLSYGLHPELLWRPIKPDGALHVRAATGFVAGPELSNVPLGLGIRGVAFPRKMVRPGLGIGMQLQTFLPHQHSPILRLDQYLELTTDVRVAEGWRVGMELAPQFGMTPGFGLGMSARIGVQRDLPW